jgi:hypothetical protein
MKKENTCRLNPQIDLDELLSGDTRADWDRVACKLEQACNWEDLNDKYGRVVRWVEDMYLTNRIDQKAYETLKLVSDQSNKQVVERLIGTA